jgi:hypothetical protein
MDRLKKTRKEDSLSGVVFLFLIRLKLAAPDPRQRHRAESWAMCQAVETSSARPMLTIPILMPCG